MSEIKAGLIFKSRFVCSYGKEFRKYIDYIDREEAVRNEKFSDFSLYNDYMDNPEKSGKLFTAEKDSLTDAEKGRLKEAFTLAQKNKSLLWQHVISFDNRYLAEHGVYDPKTKALDEDKMRQLTREAMGALMQDNHFTDSAIWSASVHYNTDNIHVHIAMCEPIPTRTRGKLFPKSLYHAKSKIAGVILHREPYQEHIRQLVREQMIQGKRQHMSLKDREFRGMFHELYQQLPADRKKWFYNHKDMAYLRPQIDKFAEQFINLRYKAEFEELKQLLHQEQRVYKETYGGKKYDTYAEKRLQDLRTRMGNTILKELREYDKQRNEILKPVREQKRWHKNNGGMDNAYYNVRRLQRSLSDDVQKYRNELEYERLQSEMEFER